jgi:hypothetical protein
MLALFGINVETTDITILNYQGFYPVTTSPNPYDTYLYITTPTYNIVGTQAIQEWVATPLPLSEAKSGGSWQLLVQGNQNIESASASFGFSTDLLTAVSSQDSLLRPARYQQALDEMTAISDQLNDKLDLIDAATTVDEIDSIIQQPYGIFVSGRGGAGPRDMNPSYFSALNNLPPGVGEAQLEIYIPGTDTVIPYDAGLPSPYFFDSAGNCYTGTDYRTTFRIAATGQVLGTVIPAFGANVPIPWTYDPVIPAASGGSSSSAR